MQIRCKPLAGLMLMAMSLSAQTSKPKYLSHSDSVCKATLADGTPYEVWDRVFVTEWEGKPSYVPVRALYKPGSGEFLWRWSLGFSDVEHASEVMDKPKKGGACLENPQHHILLLQGGEWIDFWAWNGSVCVFHSNLKFNTRKKAWSYVVEHWQDGQFAIVDGPSTKFVEVISLNQQLRADFFRPKRLEFSAQGYFYNSLGNVKKVDQNWELEIKSADEPNCATVLLDSNFKLLSVAKNPASHLTHGTCKAP
jgi:hypothetical protein